MSILSNPIVVLILLVPVPSLGVLAGMILWPDTSLGTGIFMASKVWLFLFPVIWHLSVEKGSLSLSPVKQGGYTFGILSGLLISIIIFTVYGWFGDDLIDKSWMRARLVTVGLGNPEVYFSAAAYWILINSVLEEYVWRWFVVKKWEAAAGDTAAVILSALCFTFHHIIAMTVYMDGFAVTVCSAGIFFGGLIWSWTYVRYRSIWPGYISHAIVDLCIFSIGASILF